MKLKLLPLAIGAVIAMPGAAIAAPTLYGKVNLTIENYDNNPDGDSSDFDRWEVNSNSSRIGVKGSEKISESLSAVYKAEFEMYVDDGDKSGRTFGQRNIYGGLKGGFGEVLIGKFDTPLKTVQNKVDVFSDYQLGDIKNLIKGENRVDNVIQYSAPKMGAIAAKVALLQGEEECTSAVVGDCDDGLADGFSASLAFEQDGVYAGLGVDSDVKGWDATRLVVQANIDAIQLGFLYQTAEQADVDNAEEQVGYILSGAMKLGSDGKVKLQYGVSELDNKGNNTSAETVDKTQVAIGYDHKLSKQTKLFTHYIILEEEQGSAKDEESTLAFGLEHKF